MVGCRGVRDMVGVVWGGGDKVVSGCRVVGVVEVVGLTRGVPWCKTRGRGLV